MSQGSRGLAAVGARKFEQGAQLLSEALQSSNSPVWLLARAKAYQQLKRFDDALVDAEAAYHSAIARSSGNVRKLMIEAQYRRACCLFQLKRFADADCCAKWSMLLAEGRLANEDDGVEKRVDAQGNYMVTKEEVLADKKDMPVKDWKGDKFDAAAAIALGNSNYTGYATDWNMAHMFRVQCMAAIEKLPAEDPGRKVSVTKIPPKHAQQKAVTQPEVKSTPVASEAKSSKTRDSETEESDAEIPEAETQDLGPIPDEKLKLRTDFFQTNQNMNISLYAKDVKKDQLTVEFMDDKVLIGPIPREAAPHIQAGDRQSFSTIFLSRPINTAGSRFSVTPRKIELVLQKASPEKWSSWGKEEIGDWLTDGGANAIQTTTLITARYPQTSEPVEPVPKPVSGPVYPTSSKSGPKNWDKMANEEKDDDDQDVDGFFQKLYKSSSEDTRRAMMKSLIESNGTCLSTDWKDVGNRTVEPSPPEGTQVKKWNA